MSTNDEPLYQTVADFIYGLGWRPDCDAQHTNLRDALPQLRGLLDPQGRDGGPAFPESYVGADRPHEGIGDGMTLRDYMAAKAMQAQVTTDMVPGEACDALLQAAADAAQDPVYRLALMSYEIADAMLKARQS